MKIALLEVKTKTNMFSPSRANRFGNITYVLLICFWKNFIYCVHRRQCSVGRHVMFSKNPLDVPPGRKLSKEEAAEALRLAIMAELDAINFYLQLARAVDDDSVRKVFEDIAREEKTHVGEFLAMLGHLDPEQVEELKKGAEEVRELTGASIPSPLDSADPDPGAANSFEGHVASEVKKLVDSARTVVKKLPTVVLGRGVDSVVLEKIINERVERVVQPLRELSYRFRVSQRAVEYALRAKQSVEMPEAVKAAISLASDEDKLVVETLLREGKVRLPLGKWDEPGASVVDVARAVGELARRGFGRPYIMVVSLARYTKLSSVSEKTGVTDLERVRMLVDEVVATHAIPDDKALVISSTPAVLDVSYGGSSEVDYIGPEDGFHTFRLWSSMAVRVRIADGIVVMEETEKEH